MFRLVRHALLAGLLAVLATWPWVLLLHDHIGQQVIDPDLQCGLWWPEQFADAVLHLRNPFVDPDLLWPKGQDTTLLIWNFGAQLLFLPVHALTGPPLGMNLVSLLTLVVNALAAAWAGRVVTRSPWGALAGLVIGATDMYAFAEGLYGRPEQAVWAPNVLYLGALAKLREEPGRRRWILAAGASLAAAGAVYWFYAYFLVILTIGLAAVRAVRGRLSARGFLDLASVGITSALFVLPFLVPVVLGVLGGTEVYSAVEAQAEPGATQQAIAALLPGNLLWPAFPAKDTSRDVSLLLLPLLGLAAVRGRGPVREIAGLGLAALVFAMGPLLGTFAAGSTGGPDASAHVLSIGGWVFHLPGVLLNQLPGYERFWWPYRWLGIALPALCIAAAWSISRSRRPRTLLALLAVGCVTQAGWALRAGPRFAVKWAPPAVFEAIAKVPWPAPILQLPLDSMMNSYVGYQAVHRQPIDGGVATHMVRDAIMGANDEEIPLVRALAETATGPAPKTWTGAEAGGYHYVVMYAAENAAQRRAFEVLGMPFYNHDNVTAWVVPGVGALPPGHEAAPGPGGSLPPTAPNLDGAPGPRGAEEPPPADVPPDDTGDADAARAPLPPADGARAAPDGLAPADRARTRPDGRPPGQGARNGRSPPRPPLR